MKQSPLVSIIIPCYNTEKYIAEAIESALNQTYQNIEVIVVDDGSTDASVEIIQSFGDRLKFDIIEHKGACAARNLGLSMSQGDYIQFLDADDVLVKEKIEIQLPYLLENKADLVFCKGYIFGDGKGVRPKKSVIKSPENIDPFVYCLNQGLSTEGPLHDRRQIEKVGGFNESLPKAQETELHIRLGAANTRIHLIDQLLYLHRHHDGPRITRTRAANDYMLKLYLGLAKTLIDKTDIYEMTEERIQAIAGRIFKFSIYAFRNGAEKIAKDGFDYALSLTPDIVYNERFLYKLSTNIVGPFATERMLKKARTIRDMLRRK